MTRPDLPARTGACALALLYLLLATPLARDRLEATMSLHMLAQIPLLAALGGAAARLLPARIQDALLARTGGALAWVVLATFASTYWMLPRALDEALVRPAWEVAKFVSLPLLVGLPLALAWRRLGAIGRGFVWTNFISMLAVLGWLYLAAPVRLCNSYLVDEQQTAGWAMVLLAIALFAGWLAALFVGSDLPPTASVDARRGDATDGRLDVSP